MFFNLEKEGGGRKKGSLLAYVTDSLCVDLPSKHALIQ